MASLTQAAMKCEEFVDILNGMADSSSNINEFQLKRIKIEVEKLKKDSPSDAYMVLGMVSCVEKDIENMHHNHLNAIKLNKCYDTISAYAISLIKSELFQESYNQALKAYKLCDGDVYKILEGLGTLILCCYYLDYKEELYNYQQQWKKIKNEDYPLPFSEDNDDNLAEMFDYFDNIIDNNPDEIDRIDPKIIAQAKKLVEGVELYEV